MSKEILFSKYQDQIKKLPWTLSKEDIINNQFKLSEEGKLSLYYAPHNEYQNIAAKIIIVGICPGWTQTKEAYLEAKKCLENKLPQEVILKRCKMSARFAGSMRNNIISMLDDIELPKALNISSTSELFTDNKLLHTTSLIPYPVFINEKNYPGHTPSIIESTLLMAYVKKHFYEEIKIMNNIVMQFSISLIIAVKNQHRVNK